MLKQFVTALPGTLAPILLTMVIGVLCSGFDKVYRRPSRFARLGGVVVGLISGVVFAAVRTLGIVTQRTVVNYPTLALCVVADVAALAFMLWVSTKNRAFFAHYNDSPQVGMTRALPVWVIDAINVGSGFVLALLYFRSFPDVILRVTNFVETGQSPFTSMMLIRALGFIMGIATSIIVALIIRSMRTSVSKQIFAITGVLLVILIAVQHSSDLLQLLTATRVLKISHILFAGLAWVLNHSNEIVIAQAAVFIIPIFASVKAGWDTALEGETLAQVRIQRQFKRRAYVAAAFSLIIIIGISVALTYGVGLTKEEVVLSPPEEYELTSTQAIVTYDQVDDGHLHRFEYHASDGTIMRFIIIKKNGGSYGVALDACENCGNAGYYEKDGKIICKKCDVAMNVATIGFKGGCNPIPLTFESKGGKITIQTADLDALSAVFRR